MGKGTDKLYITQSEWSSDAAYGASAGSNVSSSHRVDTTFKRLPFNFCSISLQPFTTPVCTADGTIFDIDNILPWLLKHRTNPVKGEKLSVDSLINLKFAKNEHGEYVDHVTYKVLTNNSHIVAISKTGNVFAYDTVERLNIKAKMWRDLVTDEEFTKKDIITLQDPYNPSNRNLSSFKNIKEGTDILTPERARSERTGGVNASALGNAGSMIKSPQTPQEPSEPAVGKYLAQTQNSPAKPPHSTKHKPSTNGTTAKPTHRALHTTGKAAASLTSTGLTPHTSSALATISAETALLRPRRIKSYGYATLHMTHGPLTLELHPYSSPKACFNFLALSKRGYYDNVLMHRNIPGFMLQGGDPSGTGRGGESCWGGVFEDEWANAPHVGFEQRGLLAMANKGKDTNSSQFFVTYRTATHLNRKHTIFGRAVLDDAEGEATLKRIETLGTKEGRSREDIKILNVTVLVDPFEEYSKSETEKGGGAGGKKEGREEDETTTWTGKRIRPNGSTEEGSVGKYLAARPPAGEVVEEWEVAASEPVRKKGRVGGGGFGNFDSW